MADTKLSALTALAAGPAETDEIYIRDVSEASADESKRITAVEALNPENFTELAAAPAGTDEIFINDGGVGKKITITNLMKASGTKEFWIPYVAQDVVGFEGASNAYPVANCGNANEEVWFSFFVPNDFSSITNAVLVMISTDTGTWNYDFYSAFAASGELHTNVELSDTSQTGAQTANQINEIDLTATTNILNGIAAGDYVGIRMLNPGGGFSADFLGLRFRYS
jgi:hypothetical protein